MLFISVQCSEAVLTQSLEYCVPVGLELAHVDDAFFGVCSVLAVAWICLHEVAEKEWEEGDDAELGVVGLGRVFE